MADRELKDPSDDSQKDLENDPSVNSQAQETTVTASTTKEAQALNPGSSLNKDHQEVETIGAGSVDTGDHQSGSPDETNYGDCPKDETDGETNQSFQEGEQGHQLASKSLGEEPLHPEPRSSPRGKAGRADAHLGSSSAAFPEEGSDRPGVSQEPPAIDPQDAQSPGHSSAEMESRGTRRRRLQAPGERTC